jgi:hypothetical protein
VLTPAWALPAFRHGATRNLGLAGGYTLHYGLLGYPAGVVPVKTVQAGEETDRLHPRIVLSDPRSQPNAGAPDFRSVCKSPEGPFTSIRS